MNKYRPSLTLDEIQFLLLALKQVESMDTAQRLIAKLKLLTIKADLGVLPPAYSTESKLSVLDRLGESASEAQTPIQKREAAYIKYKGLPSSCSGHEITLARTYMYDNNMMTPDEREAYETKYLGDA